MKIQSIKPMTRAFKRAQKDGLTPTEFFVVMTIHEDGEISSDEAAKLLHHTRTNTLIGLRKLVKERFIYKSRQVTRCNPQLKALPFYRLTEAGERIAKSWARKVVA